MKKIVYLNESRLKNIIERVIQESKKDDKFNESINISKEDIDVYRMSLYPDKDGKRGSDEMIDNIGKKLRKLNARNITYQLKRNDDIDVKFSIGDIKYKAKYNHTGTCEKIVDKKSSHKEMKEDLDPMELELGKSYKYMHPDPTQRDEMEYQGSEQDFNSLNLDSKIYKFRFKKGDGAMIFTDVTPVQPYED